MTMVGGGWWVCGGTAQHTLWTTAYSENARDFRDDFLCLTSSPYKYTLLCIGNFFGFSSSFPFLHPNDWRWGWRFSIWCTLLYMYILYMYLCGFWEIREFVCHHHRSRRHFTFHSSVRDDENGKILEMPATNAHTHTHEERRKTNFSCFANGI